MLPRRELINEIKQTLYDLDADEWELSGKLEYPFGVYTDTNIVGTFGSTYLRPFALILLISHLKLALRRLLC